MSKKFKVPFGTISITAKAKELVKEALDSNRVSSGKLVREFEERFAKLVGAEHAVAVSSGTDALVVALSVLYDYGAKRGDEIILPALSFVATGNAVLNAGFTPVFVDVQRETLNIDAAKIEEAITPATRAIIPVHLMGKPAEMDEIRCIAEKHNIIVIEDAAEAHGMEYKCSKAGQLGDMSAFSLYVAHIISTVEGGVVTTDNGEYAELMRSLRSHGRACKCRRCALNTDSGYCAQRFSGEGGEDIRFMFERVGFSCKMNELEAAVGLGNLDFYSQILAKRRANLYFLMSKFEKFAPLLSTICENMHEKIGPHAFPMIIGEGAGFTRAELTNYLESEGIETRTLFSSIPTQCDGFKFLGHKLGDFPNAEFIGNNGIHIGVHQDLGEEEMNYVLEKLKEFFEYKHVDCAVGFQGSQE